MRPSEQKALGDIEKYGCHVLQVMAEGEYPPFSYSIGIYKKLGKPEMIVVGLKESLAGSIINQYNARLKDGEEFVPGGFYSGFLGGFDCTFEKVHQKHYREYMGWARWLYGGDNFEVFQLIYPTTSGIWPWSPEAPEGFIKWQTILNKTGRRSFTA